MIRKQLSKLKITLALLSLLFGFSNNLKAKQAEFIQIIIYHFSTDSQLLKTENYLKDAYLPALHQHKVDRIGVFKPVDFLQDKRLFVIVPYQSFTHFTKINAVLKQDLLNLVAAQEYVKAKYIAAPYDRMETVFLSSFFKEPILKKPNLTASVKDKIYELRSYESATELQHQNKVQMFNEGGETKIFSRLQFNPLFYGSVIAGAKMPNLMYMTSFNSMDERKAHWAAFGSDPAWKTLSAMPLYKNNVSKIEITFLQSASYSDL